MSETVYPLLDGFTLNTQLRHNLMFQALALRETHDRLRRAGAYKPRVVTIPEDASVTAIPKFDAYEYQVYLTPGSVLWAWRFVGRPGAKYSIQIRDGCTDVKLWSEVVSMAVSQGNKGPGQGKQNLFPTLLTIGQPGTLTVEICSLAATDSLNTQLIIDAAEPVLEEECA